MMLEHLGEKDAAERIDGAIARVCAEKLETMSAGKMGYTTTEVGDIVAGLTERKG